MVKCLRGTGKTCDTIKDVTSKARDATFHRGKICYNAINININVRLWNYKKMRKEMLTQKHQNNAKKISLPNLIIKMLLDMLLLKCGIR